MTSRLLVLAMLVACGDKDVDDTGDGTSDGGVTDDGGGTAVDGGASDGGGADGGSADGGSADGGGTSADLDGDGFSEPDDCDDADATVHPGADEVCDGVDQDCDGEVDEGLLSTFHADADGDGFGDPDTPVEACALTDGLAESADDCDDGNDAVNPAATEVCDNRLDDDCDGTDNDCGFWGEVDLEDEAAAILYGESYDDNAGEAAAMGDLDGDGYDDVVVGAVGSTIGAYGKVYVMYGPISGPALSLGDADTILTGEPKDADTGDRGSRAGEILAVVGDMDGDGYDDLAVGDTHAWYGDTDYFGAVYLLHGTSTGLPASGSMAVADSKLVPGSGGDLARDALAAVGDVDGDGIPDLLASGADLDDDGPCAYLFLGPLSSAETSADDADASFLPESAADACAHYRWSLAGVGDIDDDGTGDLAIGARYNESLGDGTGQVYVVTGLPSAGNTLSLEDAQIHISGEPIDSKDPSCCDWIGAAVAANADLNGDGDVDLATGGSWWSIDDEPVGRIGVFLGPMSAGTYDFRMADGLIEGVSVDLETNGGVSVSPDVGGDGSDDLYVWWDDWTSGRAKGRVGMFHDWDITGEATVEDADAQLENSCIAGFMQASGDADGDGVTDLLITNYSWYDGCETGASHDGYQGRVLLLPGRGL